MAAKIIAKRDKAIQIYLVSLSTDKPKTMLDSMLEAGYAETTAKHGAHELKEHPLYKAWIEKQTGNTFASKDALEKRLYGWLTANINDFFDFKEVEIHKGTGKNKITYTKTFMNIKELAELPRELTNCIESIKETKFGIEIKLVSKVSAMDMLCKINGLFLSKVEHSGEVGQVVSMSQQTILALHELEKAERLKKMKEPNNRIADYTTSQN